MRIISSVIVVAAGVFAVACGTDSSKVQGTTQAPVKATPTVKGPVVQAPVKGTPDVETPKTQTTPDTKGPVVQAPAKGTPDVKNPKSQGTPVAKDPIKVQNPKSQVTAPPVSTQPPTKQQR